ncbi:hypothetical protein VMCG_10942 [Cytospora schulzeri]|uniref:Uncharacterized protein n=1 Tax=Cytospora schulzeri TaxID=448051 RepID=A0A423V7J4_9PEZI|nr:hypothetical protein VMCG_10942 [Valsa malicola]
MSTNGSGKMTALVAPTGTDILDLAANIVHQSSSIAAYLHANNNAVRQTTSPGPDACDPPDTPEYNALHSSLTASLEKLQHLIDGPHRAMRTFICSGNDLAAFQVAFDFGFFEIVPLEEGVDMPLNELAAKAGMDVDRTSRVVRILATHRVFREARPGFVSHTATSAIFARDEELTCAGHYMLDEMWKAATSMAAAIREAPHESDSEHCGFMAGLGVPMFTYYAQNPKLAARFAKAMAGVTRVDRQITELRDCFDWGDLKGPVVDVGGGSGHISISLARMFPHLRFIVQDGSLDMLAQGKQMLGDDLAPGRDDESHARVTFMQHNFFDLQPLRNVGAFFIRQCTHNWCDRDVVNILRNFVPGLEGSTLGTPLLINDTSLCPLDFHLVYLHDVFARKLTDAGKQLVLPVPGTIPLHEERSLRQLDMLMMIGLGAKQRTLAEFESLLRQADERFKLRAVRAEGTMGLLEVYLEQ